MLGRRLVSVVFPLVLVVVYALFTLIVEERRLLDDQQDAAPPSALPTLVLHIGPPKTATTFLQSSLCTENATSFLAQDGWQYVGIFPTSCGNYTASYELEPFVGHRKTDFFMSTTNASSAQLSPVLVDRLAEIHAANQSALVINEDFVELSDEQLVALEQHVRGQWNVQVVLAYRRLWDWLPSKYGQMYRPNKFKDAWPEGENETAADNSNPLSNPLPFDLDNRGAFSNLVQKLERTGQHPVESLIRKFETFFPALTVVHLHNLQQESEEETTKAQGDPYLQHLFCSVLRNPPLHTTCAAVQSGQLGQSVNSNPSQTLDYDILAVRAWQRGLFQHNDDDERRWKNISRSVAVRAIRKNQKKNHTDFPQACLSNRTLARLLKLSLTVEANLLANLLANRRRIISPNDDTDNHEAQHRAEFETAKSERKYCHIDADRVLEDEGDWYNMLVTLGQPRKANNTNETRISTEQG